MAQYAAATANGQAVIVNAITGVIVNARTGRGGRKYVQLWYNGARHSHTLAHAWAVLNAGLSLDGCNGLHVHHLDGCNHHDTPNNYTMVCAAMHRALHKVSRV